MARSDILRMALAAACALLFATGASAESCESPKALRFALVPAQDTAGELDHYRPILDLLGRNTGKPIDVYVPPSYSALIDAMVDKRVDVAMLGPESYVRAHAKDPSIEVFATYWREVDGVQKAGPGYQSILITRKGSIFTSVESLKGATLTLVDPASTSGALIPAMIFPKERQLPPLQQFFQRVTFSGGHDRSVLAVAEGGADAAFVATPRFMEVINSGKARQDQFNVLWTSPQIPLSPFVIRTGLCGDLRKVVTGTFLTADRHEEGRKFLSNVHSLRMVPMTDSDYDIIRTIAR